MNERVRQAMKQIMKPEKTTTSSWGAIGKRDPTPRSRPNPTTSNSDMPIAWVKIFPVWLWMYFDGSQESRSLHRGIGRITGTTFQVAITRAGRHLP